MSMFFTRKDCQNIHFYFYQPFGSFCIVSYRKEEKRYRRTSGWEERGTEKDEGKKANDTAETDTVIHAETEILAYRHPASPANTAVPYHNLNTTVK